MASKKCPTSSVPIFEKRKDLEILIVWNWREMKIKRVWHDSNVCLRHTLKGELGHRLLCERQIGGTIYRPFLGLRHRAWRGYGAVGIPRWTQNSTSRWLCGCMSSFNNRRLWLGVPRVRMIGPEWPDAELKSSPKFSKSWTKSNHSSLTWRVLVFTSAQTFTMYFW